VDPIPAALRSVGCLTEVLKKQKNNKGQKEYACIRHPYQDGWERSATHQVFSQQLFMSHWDFFAFFDVKKRVSASRGKMSFRDIQGFKGTVSMKHQGRIVLFRFLHASLAKGKTRPALLLREAFLTVRKVDLSRDGRGALVSVVSERGTIL